MLARGLSFIQWRQKTISRCRHVLWDKLTFQKGVHITFTKNLSDPFLDSFLLPSWRAVRSYRPHLEERDLIWVDDWSHGPFIRRSPSWGFLGFSSAVRQMPGDMCTAPRIISLSPLSLATDVTDATPGASSLWLGTRTEAGGTAKLSVFFFFLIRSQWLHGQQVSFKQCYCSRTHWQKKIPYIGRLRKKWR